jgi:predicted amidohydrolase YtcJ
VTPVNPLRSIEIAATRKTSKGRVLGGDQAITVARALQAFTIDAAVLVLKHA